MPISIRLAGITAATAALTLLAAPAFAAPQMVATAGGSVDAPTATATATPAVKITPARLTLRHYQHAGLVAHLSGFPASTTVGAGWGTGAMGDGIGSFTTNASGIRDIHFLPPKDQALAGDYTFGVNFVVPATPDATAKRTTRSPAGDTITTTTSTYTTAATETDPATTVESVNVTYSVKGSDAKIAWGTAHRSGTSIALKATATRWSATAKKYVPWKKATVKFQERINGVWKTKTTATTSTKGVAAKTVSAKVHTWRAVVVSTKATWGVASKAHKK